MAALTLTFVLNTLTSQRLVQAVARASFFGACSALRSACVNLESMSRTIRNLDERESFFDAGTHRAKSFERERDTDDMLGASPAELAAQDWLN